MNFLLRKGSLPAAAAAAGVAAYSLSPSASSPSIVNAESRGGKEIGGGAGGASIPSQLAELRAKMVGIEKALGVNTDTSVSGVDKSHKQKMVRKKQTQRQKKRNRAKYDLIRINLKIQQSNNKANKSE
jgi:hypothetical protein